MWRKAFHAALCCWLTLSGIHEATGKTVNNLVVKDTVSAESAPRLYRNVPLGVYASAAPYAAYSFHLPAFIAAPKAAASRVVPVKEQLVLHNVNGYLRDSYGNKYVDTPQTAAYKTAFPQQFLPLQELPAHLSQPLLAAPQSKQTAPHYFVGSPYRFQVANNAPTSSFGGYSQPFAFAQNFGSLAPSQAHTHAHAAPSHTQALTAQQQPSSNSAVYANSQTAQQHQVNQYKNPQNEVKFQRLEHHLEGNHAETAHSAENSQENKAQIQAAPAKTSVTAIVNGKKTVISLDTKPPVPLLDLSLLEPLTFANPLVPQVQHFLPRINEATYHKLPEFNVNEAKQHKKDIVVQKTKSYDSGKSKHRNDGPKKKTKQPSSHSDNHHKSHPVNPTITVKGTPNKSPEFSYEIKSPNYKETYKEENISYNKATASDPVNYSYDKKTQSEPISYSYQKTEQKEPVHYNFVHTSKEPVQIKQVNYQVTSQGPKQLIYTFKPEEQNREHNHAESDDGGSSEDGGSAEESDNDAPPPSNPQNSHNNQPHHSEPSKPTPYPQNNFNNQPHYNEPSRPTYNFVPLGPESQFRPQGHVVYYSPNQAVRQHKSNDIITHRSNGNIQLVPNEEVRYEEHQEAPQRNSQHAKGPAQHTEAEYHPTPEYEEDIKIVPSEAPSDEFLKQIESYNKPPPPLTSLEQYQKFVEQQTRAQPTQPPQQYSSAAPVVLEKAKRIIIQEESPEEMHSHHEQIKAEMVDHEDNNEEDFEKAYKNAAFGFDAFEKKAADIEKDIYSPSSYGFSPSSDQGDFEVEKTPFQEYQAEGDSFPKSSRANYKDARDSTKEDYYLDYSVNRPESLADRYQNKANYYKLYQSQKPEKYFAGDQDKKKKKSEKYTVAPSFDFAPEKKQNYFAQYKAEPIKYEYNFGKEAPRDSSAHASRPYQRLKSKTHFVEPQFQYGFEPIGLPRLLDSELAAMASNDSPESEKPGMRKKIYKENWYIKKTSTSGGKPS
ncbi:putative uncharacterized protein DDB_G0291608 [Ostrinia furnacalis]|uniref:putative uncharacterized protein DDB_G0291608 n=1 Tax=Ostrinia furnacalis TaxID=93504 RepID=UPI001039950F|nr:putative uncharacterized protein DDB_G0291608 [Ostrinia furnacalis]